MGMRREQWIGQLLTIGFQGTAVDPDLRDLVEYIRPGGFIYFKRNVGAPEEIRAMSDALQAMQTEWPAFLGVDQEGGIVARLRAPFTEFPGNRALYEAWKREGSASSITAQAEVFARELRQVGLNWDFAPVLDVDSNPNNPVIGQRAFSTDPDEVGRTGIAFARALEAGGVLSCGKHVPGHGNTSLDSHLDLPVEETPLEVLRKREFLPFRAYGDAGLAALMTAHVVFKAIDPARPATLSERVLQQVVRRELGFEGLLVTDDMEMKAIDDRYGIEQSVIEAVVAGCDVILICHSADKQRRAWEALVEEDRKSNVVRERIDQALGRIRQVKKRLTAPPTFDPSQIGRADAHRLTDTLRGYAAQLAQRDPTEQLG